MKIAELADCQNDREGNLEDINVSSEQICLAYYSPTILKRVKGFFQAPENHDR
jgi:hypothetical protein